MIDYQGISIVITSSTAAIVSIVTLVRQGRLQSAQTELQTSQTDIKHNVQKIELATNSMKDALVQATREQGLLEGAAQGRKDEEERSSLKAQGAVSAMKKETE